LRRRSAFVQTTLFELAPAAAWTGIITTDDTHYDVSFFSRYPVWLLSPHSATNYHIRRPSVFGLFSRVGKLSVTSPSRL
jgi:hypothetical protein